MDFGAINTLEQKVPSGGVAGQVWTSDGTGAGKWADAPSGGNPKPIEITETQYTINKSGKYTILAIGGKGGDGGNGSDYLYRDSENSSIYVSNYGGKGGKGGYGRISSVDVDLNEGDVLTISFGTVGSNGSSGPTVRDMTEWAKLAKDGLNGLAGGSTTVRLNGSTILTASGGSSGNGGTKGTDSSKRLGGNGGSGGWGGLYGAGGKGGPSYGHNGNNQDWTGTTGTNGSDGQTYTPNSNTSVSGNNWSTAFAVFGESFITISELFDVSIQKGRVFICEMAESTFPL